MSGPDRWAGIRYVGGADMGVLAAIKITGGGNIGGERLITRELRDLTRGNLGC